MLVLARSPPAVGANAMPANIPQHNKAIVCCHLHAVIEQHFHDMVSATGSSKVQSQPVRLVPSKYICSLLQKVASTESMPAG